jgi:hypothetical protein
MHYPIVDPDQPLIVHHVRHSRDIGLADIMREGTITLDPPGLESPSPRSTAHRRIDAVARAPRPAEQAGTSRLVKCWMIELLCLGVRAYGIHADNIGCLELRCRFRSRLVSGRGGRSGPPDGDDGGSGGHFGCGATHFLCTSHAPPRHHEVLPRIPHRAVRLPHVLSLGMVERRQGGRGFEARGRI